MVPRFPSLRPIYLFHLLKHFSFILFFPNEPDESVVSDLGRNDALVALMLPALFLLTIIKSNFGKTENDVP